MKEIKECPECGARVWQSETTIRCDKCVWNRLIGVECIEDIGGYDLLDEFSELVKEEGKKPITFRRDKNKVDRLELIYEELIKRV